ncbi:DUF6624 domain-containing protein [Streptomyces californicus]|uniref:DUF6624 domain-containing protein n=1 Tax=Streptomyces californicus TaxID=67351 RepID=UPI0036BAAB24
MNASVPHRQDLATELIDRVRAARVHWSRLARTTSSDQEIGMGRHRDHANATVLRRIIADHGWPDVPLVGQEGATAAWQIALHADTQTEIQRVAARQMANAVERGTASVRQWAHLHDRCLVNAGNPQFYGTQYRLGQGGPERLPVRDPAALDRIRAEIGLPAADIALEGLRRRLSSEPSIPADDEEPTGDDDRDVTRTAELARAA